MGFFKSELKTTATGAVLPAVEGKVELQGQRLVLHGLIGEPATTVPLAQVASIAYGGLPGSVRTMEVVTTGGTAHTRRVGGRYHEAAQQFVSLVLDRQAVGA